MNHVLITFIAICAALVSLIAAGHALLFKRDSRSALGWMSISLTLPLLGPFLYWCLGINRISRRARFWQKSGRRLAGTELHPIVEREPIDLPETARHLHGLRILGDRIVRTPLRAGNRLIPLIDGEAAYPAMLTAIRSARESINLCSYIFDADGIGADFIRQLNEVADKGVEVRIIIDALGEKYSRLCLTKALAGSRIRLERYLPLRHGAYINLRNHRKVLIIDGREAFTGGMNIRSQHLPSQFLHSGAIHDIHFHVQGPVVNDLQRAFQEDWYFVTGERLDNPGLPTISHHGSAVVRCISDGPDREFRKLKQIILGALSCAERSVCIMTPYFIPDPTMVAALITAALRGVNVQIVLPGKNNLPFVAWASSAILAELLANDVKIFYQPPPFVHTKLFMVDDVWSLIGSANLDNRSLRLNFELNLSVFDADFTMALRDIFEQTLKRSHAVTLKELNNRPLPIKLRDNFARLFSPYL